MHILSSMNTSTYINLRQSDPRCRPQRAASLCDSEHYTGETSADSLITSSQVIITASEIREIVLRWTGKLFAAHMGHCVKFRH